jgi:hypothetical protein
LLQGGNESCANAPSLCFCYSAFCSPLPPGAAKTGSPNTGAAPAAEGKVITDNDRNGNTGIEIHVKHMATPQSLTPAKQTYLVWVQPRGKDPELLGALRVNEDLEGSLKAATTYKDFEIFITAEDSMKPETPSSTVILKGSVARK